MSSVGENTCTEEGRSIPKGWVETTLGEIAIINPRESIKKGEIATNIPMAYLDSFSKKIQTFEKKEFKGGTKFRNGDTLMARITPCLENGKTSYVDILEDDEIGFGSTEYIVLREKENFSNKHFLFYLSISPKFRELAIKLMTGTSGRQRVQTNSLINRKLILPKYEEQKAIANILTAFDDKIENLQAQNKTLEQTAQTIFKEWFGKYQVDDELPDGWRVGKLGDVIEIFDSQRIPLSKSQREEKKGEFRYYGATSIMDYVDEYLFDGIYLLLAEDGSVMDDEGYPFLQYVWGKFWVNNHAHILTGKYGFSTEILYLFCKQMKVAGIVTGAVQLKINQKNLLGFELVIPPEQNLAELDKLIQSFFQKVRLNSDQIEYLKKTRDTLLPKLMSGQLRVNEFKA